MGSYKLLRSVREMFGHIAYPLYTNVSWYEVPSLFFGEIGKIFFKQYMHFVGYSLRKTTDYYNMKQSKRGSTGYFLFLEIHVTYIKMSE